MKQTITKGLIWLFTGSAIALAAVMLTVFVGLVLKLAGVEMISAMYSVQEWVN